MAKQLQALLVACVLAISPMMMTQAARLSVASVSASASATPMPAAASWSVIRIADTSNCPDPNACQANFRDVLTVYCGLWALVNVVGGFLCALTSIA